MTKTAPPPETPQGELRYLKLAELKPAADNPRRHVGDVTELAQTMKTVGLIEPLVACRTNGHYTIVAGNRRFAGARLAGLDVVPVIVREFSEQQRIEAMLVENLQRADLTALEEAGAYKRLLDECGLSQRELAERVGRSQGHISKRVQLLDLPAAVRAKVDSGGITLADAVELAKLKDDPKAIAQIVRSNSYNIGGAVNVHIDRTKRDAEHRTVIERAKKAGTKILSPVKDRYGQYALPKGAIAISKAGGYDSLAIDPATHAKEPCHAIVDMPALGYSRQRAITVCTNRKNHPKLKTEDERNRAERRESGQTRDHGRGKLRKELNEIAGKRREHMTQLLAKRLPKADVVALIIDSLIDEVTWQTGPLACQMLAIELTSKADATECEKALRTYAARGETELLRAGLACSAATHEASMTDKWGHWHDATQYLALLEAHGYEPTAAELKQLPKAKAAA